MAGISKIAVSFAWSEENNGEYKAAVDTFCEELGALGIEVVRDSLVLKYGDNLEKFMREEIGKAGYLCVFLSDAYLKSHNCMYELLVARMRAYGNDDEFTSRVRIWPLFDVSKYSLPSDRDSIMDHWTSLAKRQRKYRQKHAEKIGAKTQRKIRYILEIASNLDDILEVVTERLWPRTPRQFLDAVKGECSATVALASLVSTPTPDETSVKPEGSISVDTASVFPNVISEIDTLLKADAAVARFLSENLPQLFADSVLKASALSMLRSSPDLLVDGLLKVERAIRGKHGLTADSCRCLLDILGGLLVLSVEPLWAVQWRQKNKEGGIPLPGMGETDGLGAGRTFSWLQLSLAALADSRARLDRVFLTPAVDVRRVAPMALVHESIGAQAEVDAVKAHLIRCVLGDQKGGNPDRSDVSQRRKFEQAYQDALEVMKVARLDERDPFYTCDASWVKASKTLRSDLQLSDLLLFSSPEAEPGKFLNSHIRVLSAFYRLFDLLK